MNELYHYGVKGMRWGVRKDNPSGLSSIKKAEDEWLKKHGY